MTNRGRFLRLKGMLEGMRRQYDSKPANTLSKPRSRDEDLIAKQAERFLNEHAVVMLAHYDQALKQLNDGTYGKCDKCGCEVEESRLAQLPFTLLCKTCESNRIHTEARERRISSVGVLLLRQ